MNKQLSECLGIAAIIFTILAGGGAYLRCAYLRGTYVLDADLRGACSKGFGEGIGARDCNKNIENKG